MRLSRWRSPTPKMYVITQYPAELFTNVSTTSAFNPKGPENQGCMVRQSANRSYMQLHPQEACHHTVHTAELFRKSFLSLVIQSQSPSSDTKQLFARITLSVAGVLAFMTVKAPKRSCFQHVISVFRASAFDLNRECIHLAAVATAHTAFGALGLRLGDKLKERRRSVQSYFRYRDAEQEHTEQHHARRCTENTCNRFVT